MNIITDTQLNSQLHSQHCTLSNTSKSPSKRKVSDDYKNYKKPSLTNANSNNNARQSKNDWPVFEHPEGGFIQQSPYGNIRIIKDSKNVEISTIDKSVNLQTFMSPSKSSQTLNTGTSDVKIDVNPSNEIENYMIEGYKINKSYNHHNEDILNINYSLYDASNEDISIEDVEMK